MSASPTCSPQSKALAALHVDAPPPYSATLKDVLTVVSAKAQSTSDEGDSLVYNARAAISILGQGTIVANCTEPNALLFTFSTDDSSKSPLYTQITEKTVNLWYGPSAPSGSTGFLPKDRVEIKGEVIHGKKHGDKDSEPVCTEQNHTFLRPNMPYSARYWLSIDHKNGILLFGRDYANLALALYETRLKKRAPPGVWHWTDEKVSTVRVECEMSVEC